MTLNDIWNGNLESVTVISSPSCINSTTNLSRFFLVASSNPGGLEKYSGPAEVDSDGFLSWRSCRSISHSYSRSTFQSRGTETSRTSPPQTGQSARFSGLKVYV